MGKRGIMAHNNGGHGRKGMGPKPKIENPGKIFKRLIGYVFKYYKVHCFIVFVAIIVSALAGAQGTMFTKAFAPPSLTA